VSIQRGCIFLIDVKDSHGKVNRIPLPIMGVGKYLKSKNPGICIIAVEPANSPDGFDIIQSRRLTVSMAYHMPCGGFFYTPHDSNICIILDTPLLTLIN
jgi:hypothetical protein